MQTHGLKAFVPQLSKQPVHFSERCLVCFNAVGLGEALDLLQKSSWLYWKLGVVMGEGPLIWSTFQARLPDYGVDSKSNVWTSVGLYSIEPHCRDPI